MSNTVYRINKGVNRPLEFRGLKAQFIWWLGGGIVGLLVAFAVLYISGLPALVCIGLIGIAGVVLFTQVYRMSRKYGQYGLAKKWAARRLPARIRTGTRTVFISGSGNKKD